MPVTQPAAPVASAAAPAFNPHHLASAVFVRKEHEDELRRAELALVALFAGLFVGRYVYDLIDPRDCSPCRGLLHSVTSDRTAEPSILVRCEHDPSVARRGPARVHFPAGLNWATLSCETRAEVLAVVALDGRETNAAVSWSAANNRPVYRGKSDVRAMVAPGPVLLGGATVYLAGTPHPVYPVAAGLRADREAVEAVRSLFRARPAPLVVTLPAPVKLPPVLSPSASPPRLAPTPPPAPTPAATPSRPGYRMPALATRPRVPSPARKA